MKRKYLVSLMGMICLFFSTAFANISKDGVEITEQYDCPDEDGYHRICGTLENKTSDKKKVVVTVVYHDADNIREAGASSHNTIEPGEQIEFTTFPFWENWSFDHYDVFISSVE